MHRSRLSVVMIDCAKDKIDAGVEFWSQALNMKAIHSGGSSSPYTGLEGNFRGLKIALQEIDDPSRFHLDVETDDVEAEVRRLEALGARRKEKVDSWWVMEAPSSHLFCVVPSHTDDFPDNTNVWEG